MYRNKKVMAIMASRSGRGFLILLDSGCSHHLTPRRELFGGMELNRDTVFDIHGWNGPAVAIDSHGMTVFGDTIYAPKANATLLSMDIIVSTWNTTTSDNCTVWTVIHPRDSTLKLVFEFVEGVLSCYVQQEIWGKLCDYISGPESRVDIKAAMASRIPPCSVDSSQPASGEPVCADVLPHQMVTADYMAIDKKWYQQMLETLYLHSVCCHAGNDQLIATIRNNMISECPVTVQCVYNISIIREHCINCEMGKSVKKRSGARKVLSKKPADVEAREPKSSAPPAMAGLPKHGEILALDLWFYDGLVYMITRGIKFSYLHVVYCGGKDKVSVFKAIKSILDDYSKNRMGVDSVFNMHDREACDIYGVTSDNEGSFIAAALTVFPERGITLTVVPSGDHVKLVERPIRDIKCRIRCKITEFKWLIPKNLMNWLITNIVNWINVLVPKGMITSPWYNIKGYCPKYADLVRTNWGDTVVCYRPTAALARGQCRGEAGISLGFCPGVPNAINFYSFQTKTVKARSRFVRVVDVDLVEVFGANPHSYHVPMVYEASMKGFLSEEVPAISHDISGGVPGDGDRDASNVSHLMPSTHLVPSVIENVEELDDVVESTHKVANNKYLPLAATDLEYSFPTALLDNPVNDDDTVYTEVGEADDLEGLEYLVTLADLPAYNPGESDLPDPYVPLGGGSELGFQQTINDVMTNEQVNHDILAMEQSEIGIPDVLVDPENDEPILAPST
jgi:hypothetical protein